MYLYKFHTKLVAQIKVIVALKYVAIYDANFKTATSKGLTNKLH